MAQLSNQAFQFYTATIKEEMRKFPGRFDSYQSYEDNIDTKLYMGSYVTGVTPVSGGSATTGTAQPPLARPFGNSLFTIGTNNTPLAVRDTVPMSVIATGPGSGISQTGNTFPTFSVATNDFIQVIMRSSVNATVNIAFGSGGSFTNSIAFNFTNVGPNYAAYSALISSGTVNGNPDYSALNFVRIISSVATTVDVYVIYIANNPQSFIGTRSTLLLDVLTDMDYEINRDTGEIMGFNYVERVVPTKVMGAIKFKANILNEKISSEFYGETIKRGPTNIDVVLNSETDGAKATITNNQINIGSGLDNTNTRLAVRVGDVVMNVRNVGLPDPVTCIYDNTAGTLTFATGLYNGQIPTVYYSQSMTANYYEFKNLRTGSVGHFRMQRQTTDGRIQQLEFYKAMLSKITPKQEDANVSAEAEIALLPYTKGTDKVFGRVAFL